MTYEQRLELLTLTLLNYVKSVEDVSVNNYSDNADPHKWIEELCSCRVELSRMIDTHFADIMDKLMEMVKEK